MDLLSDIRSRLPFRSFRSGEGEDRLGMVGDQLLGSGEFLVAQVDRSGLIRAASPGLCRRRGAESGELLGSGLVYLVNAGERAALAERIRMLFAGQESGPVVARLLTASGEAMPTIRWSLLALRSKDGAIDSALCIGFELKARPEAAPPSKAKLADLESLREAVERVGAENRRLRKELQQGGTGTPALPPPAVPAHLAGNEGGPVTLAELERRHIFHTLMETKWRVSGPKGAAALLGLHPNTLRSRMEKLGIGRRV